MRVAGAILIVFGFLLCLTIFGAFFGIPMIIIGIVLVAMGGRNTTITNIVSVQTAPGSRADFGAEPMIPAYTPRDVRRDPVLQPPRFEAIQAPYSSYDKNKWRTLVKYDDEIRSAVERVRPFGDSCEDELAEAYLSVNDKSYLEPIVKKIIQDTQPRP